MNDEDALVPHFEPPADDLRTGPDDDSGKIVVKCQSCDGAGTLTAHVQQGGGQPAISLVLCPHCKGEKTVEVALSSPKWRITLPEDGPRGARPICSVTFAGDVTLGDPVSDEESGHVARTATTKNAAYVSFLYAFSEIAKLRRDLRDVTASLTADVERLRRELREARVDVGAATLELRRAAGALKGRGE